MAAVVIGIDEGTNSVAVNLKEPLEEVDVVGAGTGAAATAAAPKVGFHSGAAAFNFFGTEDDDVDICWLVEENNK
jgi:hypothetical protein